MELACYLTERYDERNRLFDALKGTLDRIRKSLSGKADKAYNRRDAEGTTETERAYADGEGHAYGIASDEVRQARPLDE